MIPSPFMSSNMNRSSTIIVHLQKFSIKIILKSQQKDLISENHPELIWAPDLIKYFAVFTLSARMQ